MYCCGPNFIVLCKLIYVIKALTMYIFVLVLLQEMIDQLVVGILACADNFAIFIVLVFIITSLVNFS